MIRTISRNGLMLAAFALVTTAVIAITFNVTAPRIDAQKAKRLMGVLEEVVPSTYHDNALYLDCKLISSAQLGNEAPHVVYRGRIDGKPSALAIEATAPDGYSGNIELVIGVATDMTVLGVRAVDHKETPGLGDKIERSVSDWVTDFNGKVFSASQLKRWQVKKDGGQFDAFTGATITPRAVVGAVAKALLFVSHNQDALFDGPSDCTAGQQETDNE